MNNEDDAVSGHPSCLAEASEVQRGQDTLSGQGSKEGVPPVGGDVDDLTENEEDAPEKGEKGPTKRFAMSRLNQSGRQGGRGGIISLKMLIDDDILASGEGVFSVDYKGNTYTASLLPDGRISFVDDDEEEKLTFESPSAFSVFVKRLTNPTRKADDGWKSVKYQGHMLEHYKAEFARKRLGGEIILDDTLEPYTKRLRKDRFQPLHKPREVNHRLFTDTIPCIRRYASSEYAAIGPDDESNCQQIDQFNRGEQPFTLKVCPAAEIVLDFHSHLSMTGTIGLLGGRWDVGTKCLE
jgi:hypothetical protein